MFSSAKLPSKCNDKNSTSLRLQGLGLGFKFEGQVIRARVKL